MLAPLIAFLMAGPPAGASSLDPATAERFARLALSCVHKEYPNKIAHVLNGDADVRPARELTPAFYGCYDWHSSVHGHWLLARLARIFPAAGERRGPRLREEEEPGLPVLRDDRLREGAPAQIGHEPASE
jgi:hypothetical protein